MFDFDKDMTLKDMLNKMKHVRELELVVRWKSGTKAILERLEKPKYVEVNLDEEESELVGG